MNDVRPVDEILKENKEKILKRQRRFKCLVFNIGFEIKWLIKALQQFHEDTYFMGVEADVFRASTLVLIASPDFEPVPHGREVPQILIEINSVTGEVKLLKQKPDGGLVTTEEYKPDIEKELTSSPRKMYQEKAEASDG